MKTILVVGSEGMLAHDLLELLEQVRIEEDLRVLTGDLPELDITDPDNLSRRVRECNPDVIINCAAYTDVDGCESNQDKAMAVNGAGPGNLARAANDVGARLVHVSTDFVFDGTREGAYREQDEPAPTGVYGLSKLEGEKQVSSTAQDYLIVRTAWLFGVHRMCFPRAILDKARRGENLEVVDDQRGSPTHTVDLAEAMWKLVGADAKGLFHAAGSGSCTWFEFAEEICRQAGLDVTIEPLDSEQANRAARRPANSVLDSSRLTEATGYEFPSWRQSLGIFLDRLGY